MYLSVTNAGIAEDKIEQYIYVKNKNCQVRIKLYIIRTISTKVFDMDLKNYCKSLRKRNFSDPRSFLARELNLSKETINGYICGRRKVPLLTCIRIEQITGGVVRRDEVRPDIDWGKLSTAG